MKGNIKKMSKRLAWAESIVNVGSGLLLSILLIQPIVFSWYDIQLQLNQNIGIAIIFTIVSVVRGYIWRRWFHKKFY